MRGKVATAGNVSITQVYSRLVLPDSPAWIRVCPPGASHTIQLVVHGEVMKAEFVL